MRTGELKSGVAGTVRDRIGSEHVLQLFFLVIAVYAYIEAFGFTFGGRVFPQMSALIVIVGILLLTIRGYLPSGIRSWIEGGVDLTETVDADIDADVDPETEQTRVEAEHEFPRFQKPLHPVTFTALMVVLYVVAGYAVGFLWVTPVFVAGYLIWFDKPLLYVVALAALGLLVAYTFITVFNIRLHQGQLISLTLLEATFAVELLQSQFDVTAEIPLSGGRR